MQAKLQIVLYDTLQKFLDVYKILVFRRGQQSHVMGITYQKIQLTKYISCQFSQCE